MDVHYVVLLAPSEDGYADAAADLVEANFHVCRLPKASDELPPTLQVLLAGIKADVAVGFGFRAAHTLKVV